MDRVAVFVDAGYLFAQASVALSGQKLARRGLVLDAGKAVEVLSDVAQKLADAPLLRIYWYDGTSTGPTPQHLSLAHRDNVKLRLGFVNSVGEQKGVDSLIVTDMITLARNRAMSDAVLISGDEDLRVGMQQAQEFGVRVHLIGIRPSRGSQSLFLLQEADTTTEWSPNDFSFLTLSPSGASGNGDESVVKPATASRGPAAKSTVAPVGQDSAELALLNEVASQIADSIGEADLGVLVATIKQSGQTPRELDGRLLGVSKNRLGVPMLSSEYKRYVRAAFIGACEKRLLK